MTQLAGFPGCNKNLSLVQRSFTWMSVKQLVNRYVDGCDSFQRTKPCTLWKENCLVLLWITGITSKLNFSHSDNKHSLSLLFAVFLTLKKTCSHFYSCPAHNFIPASPWAPAPPPNSLLISTPCSTVPNQLPLYLPHSSGPLLCKLWSALATQPVLFAPTAPSKPPKPPPSLSLPLTKAKDNLYHQTNWAKVLPTIEFAHNNHNHISIPFFSLPP
ncbi:uncharacterized protein VP01_240g4 [Puccinia sorghi]|uniref:Integrase zinc-binding domain-containing protein n=1 Tax=Puccinia sorghi TaxID=27349 RepID=A0A0L6V8H9_9BASI|nr:uncharacterized protein VP01_240g4 [Puccinia sorghi]